MRAEIVDLSYMLNERGGGPVLTTVVLREDGTYVAYNLDAAGVGVLKAAIAVFEEAHGEHGAKEDLV